MKKKMFHPEGYQRDVMLSNCMLYIGNRNPLGMISPYNARREWQCEKIGQGQGMQAFEGQVKKLGWLKLSAAFYLTLLLT